MLTCVQTQLKGSSRGIGQQVEQHEAQNSNKKSNVNDRLKKSVGFFKNFAQYFVSFQVIQNK